MFVFFRIKLFGSCSLYGKLGAELYEVLENCQCVGSINNTVKVDVGSLGSSLIESTGTNECLESPESIGRVDSAVSVNITVFYGRCGRLVNALNELGKLILLL